MDFAMGIPQVGESASREVSRLHETLPDVASSEILGVICQIADLEEEKKCLRRTGTGLPGMIPREKGAKYATVN